MALACSAFMMASGAAGEGAQKADAAAGATSRDRASAGPVATTADVSSQVTTLRRAFLAGRSQLGGLVSEVKLAHMRLDRLEASEQGAEWNLALHLIVAYESGDREAPAAGSAGLIARVRAARVAEAGAAIQLGALSVQRPRMTQQVLMEGERLATATSMLQAGERSSSPSGVALEVTKARPAATPPAASDAGPSPQTGASGFVFPIPQGDVSPPTTWSLTGDGIDIAAPADTPELAACAGTVVLHGIGGLGPWTPVLHCDSPIAGHDNLYYGHAGPLHWTAVGAHVSAGQVISEVGPGIVGDSTGPDLEIGFADAGGSPLGPAGALAMMRLLRTTDRG